MFSYLSTSKQAMTTPRYIDDIPDWLKMSRDEMLEEAAMEFVNGNITYSELCEEYELIEEMFTNEEGWD